MSPFFIEHTVYIIKECLTNVSKHAKASHVELVIVQQGDHIHLEIADNGVGFDEKNENPLLDITASLVCQNVSGCLVERSI